jgi:hypothetical protein
LNARRYRQLGPLPEPEASVHHPDMDGVPITVIARLAGRSQGEPVVTVALPGVCRPQFSLLPQEFRCYTSPKHPEWPDSLYRWNNEGISWIRGHHVPDSPAVNALLTAWALWTLKEAA